ncbi:MAG: AAA family ATPase [Lachnospiraceae bacterium]|nr:AAA family ATPase [Lachnospiraceae bacterium]
MFEWKGRNRWMKKMSEVPDQKASWIWYPYLPFGRISVIHGEPGIGKSIFAARLIAACTNRRYLPDMGELKPCNVLYLTADDDLSDMVKPRLMEAGADLERVFLPSMICCRLRLRTTASSSWLQKMRSAW